MKISVIIPVRNNAVQLRDSLKSVLAQEGQSFETIIVDGYSTDNTVDVAETMLNSRDHKVLYCSGLAESLNFGFEAAQGKLILVMHSDCVMKSVNYVDRLAQLMGEDEKIAVVTGSRLSDLKKLSDKEKLFMIANAQTEIGMERYKNSESQVIFIEHKCDMFRKSAMKEIGGFATELAGKAGEDQLISSRLRDAGYRLVRTGAVQYELGYGTGETTLYGIMWKLHLYGRVQAGVLFQHASRWKDVGDIEYWSRFCNRIAQLGYTTAYAVGIIGTFLFPPFVAVLSYILTRRIINYSRQLKKLGAKKRLAFFAPLLDVTYAAGFMHGLFKYGVAEKIRKYMA